jgi:hypothetical protein
MKKYNRLFALVFMLSTLLSTKVFSQNTTLGIGARIPFGNISEYWGFKGDLNCIFNKHIMLKTSIGGETNSLQLYDYFASFVAVDGCFILGSVDRYGSNAYLGVGYGYYIMSNHSKSDMIDPGLIEEIKTEAKNTFAPNMLVGFNTPLSASLNLNLEFRYTRLRPKTQVTYYSGPENKTFIFEETKNLDPLSLYVGISWKL